MIFNLSTNVITTNLNNTTGNINIFKVTGSIAFLLWGEITTGLSSAHTVASMKVTDAVGTGITNLSATATLSSLTAGSVIFTMSSGGAMQILNITTQSATTQPAGTNTRGICKFVVTPKNTDTFYYIAHRYTTTDAPSSGAIKYSLMWHALDATATVVAQ